MKMLAGLLLIPIATACAAGGAGSPSAHEPRFSVALPSLEAVPSLEGVTGEVPDDLLAEIVAAAAEFASVDVAAIQVIVAEEVTWSDGSLGCPEPGMAYTQALVPGYRVILDAGGERLSFNAARDGRFVACENPKPPSGTGG